MTRRHDTGALLAAAGLFVCGLACMPGPMAWTPDSKHVLVWDVRVDRKTLMGPAKDRDAETALQLLDLDGKVVRTLATAKRERWVGPGACRGNRVAFVAGAGTPEIELIVTDLQGRAPRRWHREQLGQLDERAQTTLLTRVPMWLDDGRVALHVVTGDGDLLVVASEKKATRIRLPRADWVRLSPDGRQLLVARSTGKNRATLDAYPLADGKLGTPTLLARARSSRFPHAWGQGGALYLAGIRTGAAEVVRLRDGVRTVVWSQYAAEVRWLSAASKAPRLAIEYATEARWIVALLDLPSGRATAIHHSFPPAKKRGPGDTMIKLHDLNKDTDLAPRISPDGRHVALPAVSQATHSDFAYAIIDERGYMRGAYVPHSNETTRPDTLRSVLTLRLRAAIPPGLRRRAAAAPTLVDAIRIVDLAPLTTPLLRRAADHLRMELATKHENALQAAYYRKLLTAQLSPPFAAALSTP